MTSKLILNDETKPVFDNENKQIWDLILEDKTDELLSLLPREDVDDDTFDIILKEFLSEGASETLESFDFVFIGEDTSVLVRNLVRFIVALDINGNHEAIREMILNKLFDVFPAIVENIQKESYGYPARPINQLIIAEGAGMRAALNLFIFYFVKKEELESLHFVTVLRTKITLSIMGNHKNVVGHDMIETAKIKEKIGETTAALSFYNAARETLKNELYWFIESPEMGPHEDDAVMFRALKEAYLSIDRLNGTSEFMEVCSVIDEILTREYVEYDFDAEDDEDE